MKTNITDKIKFIDRASKDSNQFYRLLLKECIRKVGLELGVYENPKGHLMIQTTWEDDDIIGACKQEGIRTPTKKVRKEILEEVLKRSLKGYTVNHDMFLDIIEERRDKK